MSFDRLDDRPPECHDSSTTLAFCTVSVLYDKQVSVRFRIGCGACAYIADRCLCKIQLTCHCIHNDCRDGASGWASKNCLSASPAVFCPSVNASELSTRLCRLNSVSVGSSTPCSSSVKIPSSLSVSVSKNAHRASFYSASINSVACL